MSTTKALILGLLMAVICAAGVVALYMLPEDKPVEGGRKVLQAVREAQVHYAKGLAKLSNSSWFLTKEGETLPKSTWVTKSLQGDVTDEHLKLRKLFAVDPEALADIAKAESILAKALADHPKADPATRATAYGLLGDTRALRGQYHACVAGRHWQLAAMARQAGCRLVAEMGHLGVKARYLSDLAGQSTAALEAARTKAIETEKQLKKELDAMTQKVETLEAKKKVLQDEIVKLTGQASKLETASQLAGNAKEALRLFDQARALKAQISRTETVKVQEGTEVKEKKVAKGKEVELDKVESDINSTEAARVDLEFRYNAVGAKIRGKKGADKSPNCLDALIAGRKAFQAEKAKDLDECKQELDKKKQAILARAEKVRTNGEAAIKAVALAKAEFDKAKDDWAEAVKILSGQGQAEAQASQANVLMAKGAVLLQQYEEHKQNEGFVATVETMWIDPTTLATGPNSLPQEIKSVRGIVAEPGTKLVDPAKALYAAAIGLYDKAAKAMPSQLRWAYKGHLGRAYMRAYELSALTGTADSTMKAAAEAAFREAVERKRGSPFVQEIAEELE